MSFPLGIAFRCLIQNGLPAISVQPRPKRFGTSCLPVLLLVRYGRTSVPYFNSHRQFLFGKLFSHGPLATLDSSAGNMGTAFRLVMPWLSTYCGLSTVRQSIRVPMRLRLRSLKNSVLFSVATLPLLQPLAMLIALAIFPISLRVYRLGVSSPSCIYIL